MVQFIQKLQNTGNCFILLFLNCILDGEIQVKLNLDFEKNVFVYDWLFYLLHLSNNK